MRRAPRLDVGSEGEGIQEDLGVWPERPVDMGLLRCWSPLRAESSRIRAGFAVAPRPGT